MCQPASLTVHSPKKMIFFRLLAAVLACVSGIAHALDPGECGTPQQMTEKLKAEGQRSVATAERIEPGKKMHGLVFTMNADKSVGYVLQSDNVTGEQASQFCVQDRLADIRWYDGRKDGVPTAAKFKASDTEANRRCDELARTGKVLPRAKCHALNALLNERSSRGMQVMFQGFTVERKPNGTMEKTGNLATVVGNVTGRKVYRENAPDAATLGIEGGIIYSAIPDGASVIGVAMMFPAYTPYGLSLMP